MNWHLLIIRGSAAKADIANSAVLTRTLLQPSTLGHDTSILRIPKVLVRILALGFFSFCICRMLVNTTLIWAVIYFLCNYMIQNVSLRNWQN